MNRLTDDLDFTRLDIAADEYGDAPRIIQAVTTHNLQLRAALEAALAVIDAWQKMATVEGVTNGGIRHCLEKSAELGTALQPFKKGG